MASFLIDRGVVGLKDAWSLIPCELSQRQSIFDRTRESGITLERLTPAKACAWIAGAARWAQENGMRLPKDWQKVAAIVGPIGDWQNADVSAFVKEFAGHPLDLQQRLIGEPFETYIRRDDISFVFSDSAAFKDQDSGDYFDPLKDDEDAFEDALMDDELEEALPDEMIEPLMGRLAPVATELAEQTTKWLESGGVVPAADLTSAWTSMLFAKLVSSAALPTEEHSEDEQSDFAAELLDDMAKRGDSAGFAERRRAIRQCLEHLTTNPNMMREAVLKIGF